MSEFDPTPSNRCIIYILKEKKTYKLYYGYTNNLKRRFAEHDRESNQELIYYEAYKSELDARNRERQLKKYAQALTALKIRLKESLK